MGGVTEIKQKEQENFKPSTPEPGGRSPSSNEIEKSAASTDLTLPLKLNDECFAEAGLRSSVIVAGADGSLSSNSIYQVSDAKEGDESLSSNLNNLYPSESLDSEVVISDGIKEDKSFSRRLGRRLGECYFEFPLKQRFRLWSQFNKKRRRRLQKVRKIMNKNAVEESNEGLEDNVKSLMEETNLAEDKNVQLANENCKQKRTIKIRSIYDILGIQEGEQTRRGDRRTLKIRSIYDVLGIQEGEQARIEDRRLKEY